MKWTENLLKANGGDGARKVQDALDAGRAAVFAEDEAKALAQYRRAVELATATPGHARQRDFIVTAEMARASCLLRLGQLDEAEAVIAAQYKTAENDHQLGQIVLARGKLTAARGESPRADFELALRHARNVRVDDLEGRVLGALGEMYLGEANASYAAHLLRDAVAKINAAGDVEQSSRIVGLLGQALVESGHEVEGQQLLERALNLAKNIGSRRDERQWSAVLGKRSAREGRHQEAKQLYGRALALSNPDVPTVDYVLLLCDLSRICLSLHETGEAITYAQTAARAAEKLNVEKVTRMARGTLGVVLRAAGKHLDALPHLEAASATEPVDIEVLRSLAAAQANSGATDAAIRTYQRAIKAAEAAKSPLELAQARRDLGLTQAKLGDLLSAIHEWTAALAIYEEHKAAAQAARLLCDVANARKSLGQYARAMKDYEEALVLLNSVDETDLESRGLVLSNAANAYADVGDVESADAFFNEAITIADRLGDKIGESTRSGNYGWFLLHVGRPRRASSTIERALQLSRELNLPLHSAVQTDNLGLVHDALGDYATALDYHQQAVTLLTELNEPYWLATARINQANTLIALAHIDPAAELLDLALTTARETERVELITAALTGLAQVALGRHDPVLADTYLHEAITLARKNDLRRLLAEALTARSRQQAMTDHPAEAAASWDEAHKLYTMLHMPQGKIQPAWLAGEKRS
ncbi:MAG: tetratricopeptide repeat protein [Chloroflexi bacterium]|uniref:tetratricopeptide repeat protein n=1 Tax=Candidatus Flexifilum breve TaxID=3140694 RepID=UPI003136EBD0|nr:tetratricopeptide repeat protein [Chloroflexota bacterium]